MISVHMLKSKDIKGFFKSHYEVTQVLAHDFV